MDMKSIKIFSFIILISICLFAFVFTRGHTINEDLARESAGAELVKFATEKNLELSLFSELKCIEINAPWGFSWSYEGEPRLEGGVNIINDGTSEIYFAPVEN